MKTLFAVLASLILGCGLPATAPVPNSVKARAVALKDLPAFHGRGAYKVDPYLAAAEWLQEAGKDKATETLAKWAEERDGDKVIVLCRMLFVVRPKGEFRRPSIGAPFQPGGADSRDWPLEPLELVDGVPFLVVRGYVLGGYPEPAREYLDYCLDKCDWSTKKYKPKTAEEKQKALAKLMASDKWKVPLTDDEKRFLADQIK
ncbi:MAG: hypothetical protein JWO38_420 [Gemmataceae bacterium]|nr:hypothetical protein [Gemmataceae bacterium]